VVCQIVYEDANIIFIIITLTVEFTKNPFGLIQHIVKSVD